MDSTAQKHLKIMTSKFLVITLFSMALPLNALACSPVKAHTVFFDVNSSKITKEQLERLSEWTDWLKKTYANRELIGTEVRVETGEKDRIQLGWNRELAVRLALIDLDFTAPIFDPTGQIYVGPPRPEIPGGGIRSRSVYMNFIPDCPHECPCQMHLDSKKN